MLVVGHIPEESTPIPLGIYTPCTSAYLLRIGVYKAETHQSKTNGLNFHTTYYYLIVFLWFGF